LHRIKTVVSNKRRSRSGIKKQMEMVWTCFKKWR